MYQVNTLLLLILWKLIEKIDKYNEFLNAKKKKKQTDVDLSFIIFIISCILIIITTI